MSNYKQEITSMYAKQRNRRQEGKISLFTLF